MGSRTASLLSLVALIGCPEEPARCGDGAVDVGEDEASCCLDTGCSLGSCEASGADGARACVMPWESPCRDHGGQCLEDSPLRCADGPAPPSYDCDACGCGNADACVGGICYDAATRAAARERAALPDDLELTEYVALLTELRARDAAPLATIAASHADEPRLDPRRNTFIVGWDLRSAGVAVLATAWLEALGQGDVAASDDACTPGAGLWPDGARTRLVAPDAAARVTCAYPGMFVDCVLPLEADCALGAGFQAETAIFLDLDVTLDDADAALLVRAGSVPASLRDATLVEALNVWNDAADTVGEQVGLLVTGPTVERYAAAYPSADAHVTWILLNARTTAALRLESYRAVWADPPSQQFLVDHDIQARECVFVFADVAPGERPDRVTMTCENAGFTLTAVVDAADFTLVDVSTAGV